MLPPPLQRESERNERREEGWSIIIGCVEAEGGRSKPGTLYWLPPPPPPISLFFFFHCPKHCKHLGRSGSQNLPLSPSAIR